MGLYILATTDMPVGSYLNGYKVIPVVLVLLIWAKALSWVDKDSEAAHMKRELINSGLMAGFILGFALFIFLPNFIVAFLVLLVVLGIEAGVYLTLRKSAVGLKDLKTDFIAWIKGMGREKKPVAEIVGAVQFVAGNGSLLPAPKADTPEAESYNGIQSLLTDPFVNNAEMIDLAPSEGGVTAKYSVDGVTYTGATVSKAVGTASVAYLKAAAGLDIGEVRKPQKGSLKVNVGGKRREMQVETKGSTAGEYARLTADVKKRHDFTPDTLGFTEKQLALIKSIVLKGGGVTLLTCPKGNGLTSMSYAMLKIHDAFLQNLVTIERDQEQDIEGVTQNKLEKNATQEEEAAKVSWIISQQPDVVLMSKPESSQGAKDFVKAAAEGRRVYFAFHANSTFDALNTWRKLVGDDKIASQQLDLIINGRTLRKLCNACKQPYTPDPEQLRKLNMDAAKVDKLYQARKEPLRDPKGNPIKCEFCNELRYKGRTGMYELLVVDEHIKQIMTNGLPAEQNASAMKSAFRKQRGKYLQEVGLALVEAGETSVKEVMRVLKPAEGGEGGGASVPRSAPRKPKTPVPAA